MTRFIALILLTLSLVAGSAYAEGRGGHGRGGGAMLGPRVLGQLDLTEEQRAQIRTLVEAHRTSVAPLHEELQKNREAIRVASLTTNFSESSVRALVAGTESARTSLIVADAKLVSQIYAVLTPEQRAKLDTLRDERPAKLRRAPRP